MLTESYNEREKCVPVTDVTRIDVKKFKVKENIDSDGVSHSVLVEDVNDAFLDVPFRDFSMTTFVATGEVTRLKFVSPLGVKTLDMLDRVTDDLSEVSARLDHMELMANVAQQAQQSSQQVQ